MEQAQEHFVQPAGELADADHRDVEGVEHAGLARHRGRQLDAALQAFAHVADHSAHGLGGRLLQPRQRTRDRDAGLQQRMQLAAEQQQVVVLDLGPAAPVELDRRRALRGVGGGGDGQRRHAAADQLVGHRRGVGAIGDALQQLAAHVAGGVGEAGHGCGYGSICTDTRIASSIVVRPLPASSIALCSKVALPICSRAICTNSIGEPRLAASTSACVISSIS